MLKLLLSSKSNEEMVGFLAAMNGKKKLKQTLIVMSLSHSWQAVLLAQCPRG